MSIFKSALFGFILVVAACILLFWAEGRAVKTARALDEGKGIVMEVDAQAIVPGNEGKLVHISGDAAPQDVPADTRLAVSAEGAARLIRVVEMLQWKETEREVERTGTDGKTNKTKVFDYEKTWSASEIDSSKFKTASAPKNPPMPLKGETFEILEAKIGAFRLAGGAVAALSKNSPLQLTDSEIGQAAAAVGGTKPVWLVNNQYVAAADPDNPQVGDIRIGFERGDVSRLSAIGQQAGDRLKPYTTSNGREVFLIQAGAASADEMFKDAISNNVVLTWVIRIGGLLLMFIGFKMSFGLLTGISDNIPLLGGLIRAGTSLVGLALTLALGSLVIASGWIFYRPLLALVIAAVGVGIAFAIARFGKQGNAQPARTG